MLISHAVMLVREMLMRTVPLLRTVLYHETLNRIAIVSKAARPGLAEKSERYGSFNDVRITGPKRRYW